MKRPSSPPRVLNLVYATYSFALPDCLFSVFLSYLQCQAPRPAFFPNMFSLTIARKSEILDITLSCTASPATMPFALCYSCSGTSQETHYINTNQAVLNRNPCECSRLLKHGMKGIVSTCLKLQHVYYGFDTEGRRSVCEEVLCGGASGAAPPQMMCFPQL